MGSDFFSDINRTFFLKYSFNKNIMYCHIFFKNNLLNHYLIRKKTRLVSL